MVAKTKKVVEITKSYYDSTDADNFYFLVWGGEDLHLGIYESENDSIFEASRRTVDRMAAQTQLLGSGCEALDIGAGFGGSARRLVSTAGCRVTCLNLSERENERNRQMNMEQGMAESIDVVDGDFSSLPFPDGRFDLAWSQDAILHGDDREGILREVSRVLRPGGEFVFTDPMKSDHCPDGVLGPILERIHLKTLGSPGFYIETAKKLGMKLVNHEDWTPDLVRHYSRVFDETTRKAPELEGKVSQEYIDRMKAGLKHWINGGKEGYLAWGVFCFRKED